MIIINYNGEKKAEVSDFDLTRIFECGQCFRWNPDEHGVYEGVAMGRVARLRQDGNTVFMTGGYGDFESIWFKYFDLCRDYAKIREQLCLTDFIRMAISFGAGIRILRQEPWEALCSFIISQNNHIPRIKKIVDSLCREFGSMLQFDNKNYYSFPCAKNLALLDEKDLTPLRCGYRSNFILNAAKAVADGSLDLSALSELTSEEARNKLKTLQGVGDKVADCVLLYGLHMLNTFPVDVWIKRAIDSHCDEGFNPEFFAPYAGIAQQYIFHYMRSVKPLYSEA